MYFDDELFKNQSNFKKTWQVISSAINKKPKNKNENIPGIFNNNILKKQPSEIADIVNSFFSTEHENIAMKINPTGGPDLDPEEDLGQDQPYNEPRFQSADSQIGHEEIFNALKLPE